MRRCPIIVAVLDGSGWDRAYLMGHSWGGYLVFHAAVSIPERLSEMLSVDPLGAVGDGQVEAFGAEMLARVPECLRERARTLDEKDTAGEATRHMRRSPCSGGRASPILPLRRPCRTSSSPSRRAKGCGRT